MNKLRIIVFFIILGVLAFGIYSVRSCINGTSSPFSFHIGKDKKIEQTPIQLRSIEKIGQWEFLSIQDEEIIDTTRKHLLMRDDKLVRIYRGTLRLGIDFNDCQPNWAMACQDTAILTLPAIKLLDQNFIDEARTESFYESGSWDATTRQQMYQRAQQRMINRCMTPDNIQSAEENARTQVEALFRTLGYPVVRVIITSQPSSQP